MKIDQQRAIHVLKNMIAQCEEDRDVAHVYCDELEDMLNGLKDEDFFGTEAQIDPRGDFREDEWAMWHVQGIDEPQGPEGPEE